MNDEATGMVALAMRRDVTFTDSMPKRGRRQRALISRVVVACISLSSAFTSFIADRRDRFETFLG